MHAIVLLILVALAPLCNAQCQSQARERFAEFYSRFAEDKVFAVSRTLYPTTMIRHEYGFEDGKEVVSQVKTKVTKAMDATTPTIADLMQHNSMQSKQKSLSSHEAVVDVFKPDTDWLLSYHFRAKGNCWHLHHIEDHSL